MGRLSKLVENVKKIDYDELLDEAFQETEDVLIELLQSQLRSGEKANGEMPPYSLRSKSRKKGKVLIDLYDTGAFYEGFKVYQNKFSLRVRSTDKKNMILLSDYGPEIFELNDKNKAFYIKFHVIPIYLKKIKNGLLR